MSQEKTVSVPPNEKDWNQALSIIHQIGHSLSTSIQTMDIEAICRLVLHNPDLRDLLPFEMAKICLWNAETEKLIPVLRFSELDNKTIPSSYHHHHRLYEGYSGWIAIHRKTLLIKDTHHQHDITPEIGLDKFKYRSYMGVPLMVGPKFLGTIELAATPTNIYQHHDITLVEILATQIAFSINSIPLFQEQRGEKFPPRLDASDETSFILSYDEALHNLAQHMIEAFLADDCAIFNFDNDERQTSLRLIHRYSHRQTHLLTSDFTRMIQQMLPWRTSLQNHTSFIIRQTDPEAKPDEITLLKELDYGSLMIIPLISRQKATGLLILFSTDPHFFNQEQMRLVHSQANIAMENARLFRLTDRQLQNRVDELAGLQRVSSELNSTLDLDKILNLVLEEAMQVTGASFGNINLYDAETLIAYKWQDWSHPGLPIQDSLENPIDQGVMEQALQSGKSMLVADVRRGPTYRGLKADTRSRVVIPIYYSEQPVGLINLESRDISFFNKSQLRYLKALANQAAVAIGNAQAYQEHKQEREQANQRAEQLSRLAEISKTFRTNRPLNKILEDIAYAIIESIGYNVVMISLVGGTPPMIHHKVGAGIPLNQFAELQKPAYAWPLSILDLIMQEKYRLGLSYFVPASKPNNSYPSYIERFGNFILNQPKEHPLGPLLFVPLADIDEQIIGLLTIESHYTEIEPDLSTIQTLETFANHAATAIENARLFEREKQRRRLADTLRGVAETISSQLAIDELLNVVLRELTNVIDYDSASVQELHDDQLIITGGHGWSDSTKMFGLAFSMKGNNPSRLVVETQEPLIIKDVQENYPEIFAHPPHNQVKSWLGVPLTYGANILGLITLESNQVGFFSPEDAELFLAFANQVAVAMVNAQLFEKTNQRVRQLGALTEVAQALNRALDISEVLDLVLEAVSEFTGGSQGFIWLIDSNTNTLKIANTKKIPAFLVKLIDESNLSITLEPFASVIESGQVEIIKRGIIPRDTIANYGFPLPDDVTYVPLRTEDGIIGLLSIEAVIRGKNMLNLVTTLANLTAVAIERTRLLEATRKRANEMQTLYNLGIEISGMIEVRSVMHAVIKRTITLTDTQIGTILFWVDNDQHYLIDGAASTKTLNTQFALDKVEEVTKLKISQPFPTEPDRLALWFHLTEEIIESGQPLNLNIAKSKEIQFADLLELAHDLNLHAILGVPIKIQNQPVGAIFIGTTTIHNFTDHDIQLLSFVANQATEAIRNAQLVQSLNSLTEELEHRVAQRTEELARTLEDLTLERDRVETLYQITRDLSTSFDLDRVLNQALQLINQAVGISYGSVLLLDQDSDKLIHRAAIGRKRTIPRGGTETKYKIGYGLAGTVIKDRQPRLVPDLSQDSDWVVNETTPNNRSAMVVPLISGDEPLGALLLFHPQVDYFTEGHLKLVSAACTQVSAAVNNAELYRLITEQANRLGVMLRTQATEMAKNEAILNGITDGVLVLDPMRQIVLINPKATEILEIDKRSELVGQPLQQILEHSTLELTQQFHTEFLAALARIEAEESATEFRIEENNKAIDVTLAPVAIGPEDFPNIVSVVRDISKEAEIERLRKEFISTVSHELRTPMTSIKGYADLLISAHPMIGDLTPKQRDFVKVIQSNANRLTELVNDILEISRIETGRITLKQEEVDIISVIEEVATSFEGQLAQKAMNFTLKLPESLPTIYTDKARVIQILVNLIGNAWQYTPEGGDIIVQVRQHEDDFIQIDVEDTGVGIIEKDIQYIFQRFFRSERTEVQVVDGTGLGLSITQSFVEMLGGEIWVESEIDVGTTFSFTLPLVPVDQPLQENMTSE